MRANVFTDPALAPVVAQFVWLNINTERAENHRFVDRFPIDSWPTYFVLDAHSGKPIRKWVGGCTAAELVARLRDVAAHRAGAHGAAPRADRAAEALARAEQLDATGDAAAAANAYRTALQHAPSGWAQRPQAVEGLVFALWDAGERADCVRLAVQQAKRLPKGSALANVITMGLYGALELPASNPMAGHEAELEHEVEALAKDPSALLMADDRSGLYEMLVEARQRHHDDAGVHRVALAWRTFLDAQAVAAKTPEARAVFDSHRLSADLALGEPARAIPMLQQSEHDLPNDYNPPARLAVAYLALHQPQEAVAASKRALTKVYGPRTIRVLLNEAKAYAQLHQPGPARRAIERAATIATGLGKAQHGPALRRAVAAARAKLKLGPSAH